MRIIRVVALWALALVVGSSFAQSCNNAYPLGEMGPPGVAAIGNSFKSAGKYTDCYTFELSSSAGSFGGAIELNKLFNSLDIDVTSVSLFSSGTQLGYDDTPLTFSFGTLAGGVKYTLAVASSVTSVFGLYTEPVGYVGAFATYAAPVPEPATYALVMIGLLGVGIAVRRRQS